MEGNKKKQKEHSEKHYKNSRETEGKPRDKEDRCSDYSLCLTPCPLSASSITEPQ